MRRRSAETAPAADRDPRPGPPGVSRRSRWLSNAVRAQARQHRYALRESLKQLAATPWHHGLTTILIGLALTGPGLLYLTAINGARLGADPASSAAMSVFLNVDLSDADADRLAERLTAQPDIQAVEVMTRAQALAEFRELSDYARLLDTLHINPLPALLLVQPAATLSAAQARRLAQDLRALPETHRVIADLPWIQRLSAITRLTQRLLWLIGALMALGIVWLTGNTLRLHIDNRRDDIAITARLGGDGAFIRRPFLYLGVYYGVGGGLVAMGAVALGRRLIATPAQHIASLYSAEFDFIGLGWRAAAVGVLIGVTLTGLSAWLSVDRALRRHASP